MKTIFTEGWERRLDPMFFNLSCAQKKAYICSPLSADTKEEYLSNIVNARAYMLYASEIMGLAARAPHAYLPLLLCDKIPSERALALEFGEKLLANCDTILVCGNRLSCGMRNELLRAVSLNLNIVVFDEDLYMQVKKLFTQAGGVKKRIRLNREHPLMAENPVSVSMGKETYYAM